MSHAANVDEILRAEQDLYRAMIAKDLAALERILAPDVVYGHSTAVAESRDEYVAGVAMGLYDYESIATRGARIRVHGETAIIDGICDMRVGVAGQKKDLIHLLFVLVWIRMDDHWRLAHRHATRIASPPAHSLDDRKP